MSVLRRFLKSNTASSFESLALVLSVIAVFSVGFADVLHYSTMKNGALARFVAGVRAQMADLSQDRAVRDGIDYSPTGSIIGLRRGASLSPCSTDGR